MIVSITSVKLLVWETFAEFAATTLLVSRFYWVYRVFTPRALRS